MFPRMVCGLLFAVMLQITAGAQETTRQPATTLQDVLDEMKEECEKGNCRIISDCFNPARTLPSECDSCSSYFDLSCAIKAPPSPRYPTSRTDLGEAFCDARIRFLETGRVEVMSVQCNKPEFEITTRHGFEAMRWDPEAECGCSCSMIGREISYPIEYRFE